MANEIGIRVTSDRLGRISDEMRARFRRLVKRTTFEIEAGAKVRAPVDTGALRSSIQSTFENDGMTGVVGVGVEYAAYQEYGTANMAAHPYLAPAVEDARVGFEASVEAILQGRDS